jgi:CRP/FNR family transcriptional regulator, anaerobic regulatory protein
MENKVFEYSLSFFSDLKLVDEISEKGIVHHFEAGKSIMEPGQYIKYVPIILSGAVRVIRIDEDKELFLYYLKAGDSCALSLTCCSTNQPSEIKAVAEEDTTVLFIPVQYHEQWLEKYKNWKDFVSKTYQLRFQELLQVIDVVAFRKMDDRLANYLLNKKKALHTNELKITHQEISAELGTSREVISRLLKVLEKKKWIELGRNIIYLRDDFEELVNG